MQMAPAVPKGTTTLLRQLPPTTPPPSAEVAARTAALASTKHVNVPMASAAPSARSIPPLVTPTPAFTVHVQKFPAATAAPVTQGGRATNATSTSMIAPRTSVAQTASASTWSTTSPASAQRGMRDVSARMSSTTAPPTHAQTALPATTASARTCVGIARMHPASTVGHAQPALMATHARAPPGPLAPIASVPHRWGATTMGSATLGLGRIAATAPTTAPGGPKENRIASSAAAGTWIAVPIPAAGCARTPPTTPSAPLAPLPLSVTPTHASTGASAVAPAPEPSTAPAPYHTVGRPVNANTAAGPVGMATAMPGPGRTATHAPPIVCRKGRARRATAVGEGAPAIVGVAVSASRPPPDAKQIRPVRPAVASPA
mmetsp:Transcript_88715/g.153970  ORF Transcript_88715/g.153970 Transcript_88715/m.153970 type:complete len:374 (+) Transcript_88715:1162-2283(+)